LSISVVLDYVHNIVYTPAYVNRKVYTMTKDFRAITEALFARVGVEDFAAEAGCSPQTVKQARLEAGKLGRRSPPPGWEAAARKLAERQAAHFRKLADRLSAESS
jgi:hypothetical protein